METTNRAAGRSGRSLAFRRRLAAALFVSAALPLAAAGPAIDFAGEAFPVSYLAQLVDLEKAVRYDQADRIVAAWSAVYPGLVVKELPEARIRYLFGVSADGLGQIIAVRGTVNTANIAVDLRYDKEPDAALGIAVHRGFALAAAALYADLKPLLKPELPVTVVGHSLGAAEAIIVGMYLQRDGFDVRRVVAFAPPKVTDAAGWERYAALPVLRVVGPFDPVPFLFPSSRNPAAPYTQGGPLLMLLDGPYYTVAAAGFYDDFAVSAQAEKRDGDHFAAEDHAVLVYAARLAAKRDAAQAVPFADRDRYAKKP
jgi:hypothetical protein